TTGSMLELDARYLFWRQLSVLGSTMANQREFDEVMKLLFMGRLKPVVDRVFPLTQAQQAHEYLEKGEQFGKVVLAID
ncbi:MAG: zinc-binding dehydrogenase, partial [Thermoplasmata archaeon]|nr:zinc-binding dehydrogenase [Thermoplasmata archaeon]